MQWVRMPTRLPTSPEVCDLIGLHGQAGMAAGFVHLAALSWSAEHDTSGDVPKGLLRMLGARPRHAALLVEVGLWTPMPNGWWIVDFWECMQPEKREHIPTELRRAVYDRDGNACLACGATDRLSLDHIEPWSRGGRDTLENLRTLCVHCNSARRARSDEEWGGI